MCSVTGGHIYIFLKARIHRWELQIVIEKKQVYKHSSMMQSGTLKHEILQNTKKNRTEEMLCIERDIYTARSTSLKCVVSRKYKRSNLQMNVCSTYTKSWWIRKVEALIGKVVESKRFGGKRAPWKKKTGFCTRQKMYEQAVAWIGKQ